MKKLKRISNQVVKTSTDEYSKVKTKIAERVERKAVDPMTLIPSPCVPFNLECSGRHEGAFQLGKITNLIGDSHAGKTLFVLSIFAECGLLPRFDEYRFIYDDVERANEFDLEYLFGSKLAERLESPNESALNEANECSHTVEQFNDNVARALDDGRPFIYVLDSFDGLTSEMAIATDKENRKLRDAGKESKGSYGDGKAKSMSDFFKLRVADLKHSNSAIIIISQTRDNLGFGAMFNPKVRSGGKALKFFSAHEVWLAMQKKEKKGSRTYITNVQAKITKNKITGRHGEAFFPILFDYGVDNISSCIRFLVQEKLWTKTGQSINTGNFHPDGKVTMSKLISWIEAHDLEKDINELCQQVYDDIIVELSPNRKRKY